MFLCASVLMVVMQSISPLLAKSDLPPTCPSRGCLTPKCVGQGLSGVALEQ